MEEKEDRTLEVQIEMNIKAKEEIKELVKMADELQKEYSCHCTLSVKQAYL